MKDQDVSSRGDLPKSALHASSNSIDSTLSSANTLRDEELKDLEAWSTSPKKLSLEIGEEEDDHLLAIPTTPPRVPSPDARKKPEKKKTATWKSLPRKGQLALLTASRLAEPLTQTSLQSYMFYQLKSFDASQTDAQISAQAGMLAAAFTFAQFITAIPWGRAADNELIGRKMVLMIGLLGTMISAVGFGFSRSFYAAVFFRSLGGAVSASALDSLERSINTLTVEWKRWSYENNDFGNYPREEVRHFTNLIRP